MNWLNLNLNRKLNGQGPGTIRVKKGSDGKPKDKYWRDRLKDAETDGCCELVEAPKKASSKTSKKGET